MLFILLFTLGTLAIPLILDFDRNGRNNILARSAREALCIPIVASFAKELRSAKYSLSSLAGWLIRRIFVFVVVIFSLCIAAWWMLTINSDFTWIAIALILGVITLVKIKY